jgi:hypothetical protein
MTKIDYSSELWQYGGKGDCVILHKTNHCRYGIKLF